MHCAGANYLYDVVVSVVTPNGKDLVGWVCEETTKDMLSGEKLLGLLAEEKEKLSKILIEDCEKLKKVKSPHFWETKYSPNLARTYPDRTDGGKNDALQRNPSGRFSSGVCGTSEARPSFAQVCFQFCQIPCVQNILQ